ncbi:uncharacterized protein LOC136078968 [Hydra vulgaris]|uniref:Uncharacterized protein LOC136078968 n=1 Tax=Hydra vulgaris TaxID=6087 RepID=A0ABM4BNY7_HYDVU
MFDLTACATVYTRSSPWKDTMAEEPEAATYESAVSDLCRYVKQATGIQEQLPKSLKHGGDTRPWISMFRRADSVEDSYDALVVILTNKDKLSTIANISRKVNREIRDVTDGIKDIFEGMEKVTEPTMQLVVPSNYLLIKRLQPAPGLTTAAATFRQKLIKYLDLKF